MSEGEEAMAGAAVEYQPTPNPNAGKFVTDRSVVPDGGSRSYFDPEEAREDPVARALMGLSGVQSIFMVDDFITVTKAAAADWDDLIPEVSRVIRDTL
ncbi:MAG: NifU N-terminal domain-containing protein [Gemmatimonadota bacterium]